MKCKTIDFELQKVKAKGEKGQFEGYASVFNVVDYHNDIIVKGAFTETIQKRQAPVAMLYQHRQTEVIGKWVHMEEDNHGLFVVGELTPKHSLAENVRASIEHGALNGMSIGFDIPSGQIEHDEQTNTTKIKAVDLWEISLVTFPANQDSRIDVVKHLEGITSISEAETVLRDVAFFSLKEAKAFMASLKNIALRDVERARIASEVENAISNIFKI